MPLPTPKLDDLTFQQIVDHARKLIPVYCPEWTDHNVSDPGITLIELFASMAELLLYRVNQVPDKMYLTLLNLIGYQLAEPRAAHAPVTFYLATPATRRETIEAGTEVSTLRTETRAPIIFTTTVPLEIRPPHLMAVATQRALETPRSQAMTNHRFSVPLPLFGQPTPQPDDALYLGLADDHSDYVLDVEVRCVPQQGIGIKTDQPAPQVWEASSAHASGWAACATEYDTSSGFNFNGRIRLRVPPMHQSTVDGVTAFWLRCRLTEQQTGAEGSYTKPPQLEGAEVLASGKTGPVRHAVSVQNEQLGRSDGTRDQQFRLRYTPLLARNHDTDYLEVVSSGGERQRWHEVRDFGDSQPDDRHYTLDSHTGALAFGPVLPQPSGGVYRFGAAPAPGSALTFSRYQHGGGVAGNVAAGTITVLKTSLSPIGRVTNWREGRDGIDGQSLDDARLRAPQFLRTRARAVTADDFEHLAHAASPLVGRAHCLAPGAHPDSSRPQPGAVVLYVLPHVDRPASLLSDELLDPSSELLAQVRADVGKRLVLGSALEVRAPECVRVGVRVVLRTLAGGGSGLRSAVRQEAEAALYRYLSPYVGGPAGQGWPFGRTLLAADVAAVLQQVPGVEQVPSVELLPPGGAEPVAEIALRPSEVICAAQPQIQVI